MREKIKVACVASQPLYFMGLLKQYWGVIGFKEGHLKSLGAEFLMKDVTKGANTLKLQFFVIQPYPEMRELRETYLRGSNCCIIWDTDDELSISTLDHTLESFISDETAEKWKTDRKKTSPKMLIYVGSDNNSCIENATVKMTEGELLRLSNDEFRSGSTPQTLFDFFAPHIFGKKSS
jgi:hypothetical protein